MSKRTQTISEEYANAITHSIGILFVLIAMPFLVNNSLSAQPYFLTIGMIIFAIGMLCSYSSSTLYHIYQNINIKRKLKIFDHISIFLLIGGTYTPIVQRYTEFYTAFIFLLVMWILIFAGAVLKLFFTGKYKILSTILYILLGWMVVFIAQPLSLTMPLHVFYWVLIGGLSYTIGAIFYLNDGKIYYGHAIWHCFVLFGSIAHFIAVAKSIH
ncbi:MAG: hemolysin D [Bacteroidetes bacterium]|nr:MAG: hemolysin D [Bacteroidota bacterium]TAG87987.1 MAG: hemolysin D [Bacteroidota bacterium]